MFVCVHAYKRASFHLFCVSFLSLLGPLKNVSVPFCQSRSQSAKAQNVTLSFTQPLIKAPELWSPLVTIHLFDHLRHTCLFPSLICCLLISITSLSFPSLSPTSLLLSSPYLCCVYLSCVISSSLSLPRSTSSSHLLFFMSTSY